MPTWLWADVIVAVHFAYIAYVVLMVPAVLVGWLLRWQWVRNSWLRNIHLVLIGIVVAESLVGFECPLTTWEHDARIAAGGQASARSFIGQWLHRLLFFDFQPWVFTVAYVLFGALVIGLYVAVPPRWLGRLHRRQAP